MKIITNESSFNIFSLLEKPRKGQSLVELALTITILLILLAGAFVLGSAFIDYIALRDAAQEGAIYGSVDPTHLTDIITRVKQSSNHPVNFNNFVESCSGGNPGGICIEFTGSPCLGEFTSDSNTVRNAITVTIRYEYKLTMPFIGALLEGPNPLSDPIILSASVTNAILTPLCK